MAVNNLSKEKEFVVDCFTHFSKFAHDKLKELAEKEKEKSKQHASLLWSSFLHLLLTFNDLEKTFYSLVFLLGSSNFGARLLLGKREDTLRARYSCLLTELRQIENAHKGSPFNPNKMVKFPNAPSSNSTVEINQNYEDLNTCQTLEHLVSMVCEQLQHFVLARMNTISFYEQMPSLHANKNVSIDDLLKTITTTLEEFLMKVRNPVIECFKCTYRMECEVVIHLLKAQVHLQKCQYLESLLSLQCASQNLAAWNNMLTPREAKKSTFGTVNPKVSMPELFEWLCKLKALLLSKFSLYFFDVLCQQCATVNEVKTLMNKAPFDFYGRFVAFYKKVDASCIMLVLNKTPEFSEFNKLGYSLPCKVNNDGGKNGVKKLEAIGGGSSMSVETKGSNTVDLTSLHLPKSSSTIDFYNNHIIMFSYPHDKSEKNLAHVHNVLKEKKLELEQQDKIVYSLDVKQQCTSATMNVEGCIYLVTILNRKNTKADTNITNFYSTLCADLRCTKIFMGIKSNSK